MNKSDLIRLCTSTAQTPSHGTWPTPYSSCDCVWKCVIAWVSLFAVAVRANVWLALIVTIKVVLYEQCCKGVFWKLTKPQPIIFVSVFLVTENVPCSINTFVSNLLLSFCLPSASCGMSTKWKCVLTTIWTSSAPTTPTVRCHRMQLSATFCTWWRRKTTRCASLTPSTSCVGSAHGRLLPTPPRNSQRNSSVLPPLPWARNSDREKAIIISVSIINKTFSSTCCDPQKVSCTKTVPSSLFSTAKPMHHHGQDCLRLKVDVAGNSGSAKTNVEKSKAENTGKSSDGGKGKLPSGGVHNPSNRLPAGEDRLN